MRIGPLGSAVSEVQLTVRENNLMNKKNKSVMNSTGKIIIITTVSVKSFLPCTSLCSTQHTHGRAYLR